ncbi:hypothetical protein QCA50_016559 [Cerrena zonata]|uniref:SET domain-containing protein n=1 Tax=Cerrena zonata TaxID=2478898 RepID=A0AAW0FQ25_9APHY
MNRGQRLSNNGVPATTTRRGKIKIPTGPLRPESVPTFAGDDSQTNVFWTTLPPYDSVGPDEPLTHCLLRVGVKEKILAIPGFPHPLIVPDPPRYKITPIPGAGMGMTATVDIDVGDLIVVERPLIISTQVVAAMGDLPSLHPKEFQRMLVERLNKQSYEDFFALHNCKGYTRENFTGIIDTNSIGIGNIPGYNGQCAAVCKLISRANHSCCNNATWGFRVETFAVELRALLPIKKGEQVFVNYGTKLDTRAERQQYLLKRYKFNCTCPACSSDSEESDQMRLMIESASRINICGDESALRRWVNDRTKADDLILAECHAMINVLDAERLYCEPVWTVWYERLVKAYCALEDEENVRKWAEKAAKLSRAYVLHDAGWDAVAKDPKKTEWWGLRANTRSGIRLVEDLDNFHFERGTMDSNTLRDSGAGAVISTVPVRMR